MSSKRFSISGNAEIFHLAPTLATTSRGSTFSAKCVRSAEAARRLGLPVPRAAALFEEGRAALWHARSNRPRPARDGLLITQMNGALISAFTRAAMMLGDDTLLARAQRCARFVRASLWQRSSQTLYRCCTDRSPEASSPAPRITRSSSPAALDLYEATGDQRGSNGPRSLQRSFDSHYGDEAKADTSMRDATSLMSRSS